MIAPPVRFDVRRHGVPIADVPLRGTVNPDITYSQSFSEWEAGTAAGLDMWAWEAGIYPPAFKARVLAWYAGHRLVNLHSDAAVNAAMERRMRRKG